MIRNTILKSVSRGAVFACVALLWWSCSKNLPSTPENNSGERELAPVKIKIELPGMGLPPTKSEADYPHEYAIKSLDVLLFLKNGNGGAGSLELHFTVDINTISHDGNYLVFEVPPENFPTIEGDYDFVVLANLPYPLNTASWNGDPKQDVLNKFTHEYEFDGTIPSSISMWGEIPVSFNDGIQSTPILTLLRSLAAIDIEVAEEIQDKFEMLQIGILNYNINVRVAPHPENYSSALRRVTASSLPASLFMMPVNMVPLSSRSSSAGEFYMPERDNSQLEEESRATIVLYALLKDNDPTASEPEIRSYYGIFLNDSRGNPVDILRNHRYKITINNVLGPGALQPEEIFEHHFGLATGIVNWTDGEQIETELSGKP